ncbi:hypothetical protein [Bradyrhizobium genosp. P]|uniref:hypothetical protein n=1 Tax=Bradyrhizobium genosp. P TaxID=83641 RepID=UPI003CF0E611
MLRRGIDLSALGSGKTIFGSFGTVTGAVTASLINCKLNASVTVGGNPTTQAGSYFVHNCDSGATNTRNEVYAFEGTETTELTMVRGGGASDGTTAAARKIVTTANAKFKDPYSASPIAIWNETVGSSITMTLFGIWGGGPVPNNDDFWIEADYLGSSSQPISSRATSSKSDPLAAGSALSSNSSSWGGSTTAFKTSVTITPQLKGYIYVTPKMAKASTTLYVDPKLMVA